MAKKKIRDDILSRVLKVIKTKENFKVTFYSVLKLYKCLC